ncbi:hypothetical protein AVEN_40273-1 [Araneus ventricosus]|uniref:BPTI/Kunitz inhibitor domain-containing protein n=1 Tax=Araneus ventricosus TaxID=182803 RepID=A0A4Y2U093_ARAVE|nr:hypothetical protein AVEN_98561-1 [Araneus ventricosus]GBO06389.1 hypothetical protein AVEN_103982-1 [Araneus ventricosus]GBO06395.1 hypothetical protein AVEN_40273-1 [Araneus ventricosus]
MDQHSYRSASNSLLDRTADRTQETFALQGDPSRTTHTSDLVAVLKYSLLQAVTSHEKEICNLPGSYGNCTATVVMWFHEILDHTCRELRYSGCGGNRNRFDSYEECYKACISAKGETDSVTISNPYKDSKRKESTIDLVSHAIIIPKDEGNVTENRNIKNTPEKRKGREDFNRKNKNKSENVNSTNRTIKRNKSYRKRKSRIKDGQRPVNIKKGIRKSTTNTNDENKVRKAEDKSGMDERENKAKNRQSRKENRGNCRQEHDGSGRARGKNMARKHCLYSKRRNTAMKNNSATEENNKRTGRRRLKKKRKNKNNEPTENPV